MNMKLCVCCVSIQKRNNAPGKKLYKHSHTILKLKPASLSVRKVLGLLQVVGFLQALAFVKRCPGKTKWLHFRENVFLKLPEV